MTNLKEKILKEIHQGNVAMRPQLYFTFKMLALALVGLAIVSISVFLFNFIAFSIRINSQDTLLWFGPKGLGAFLYFFPWPLLLIDIALIVLLEQLLRQFRFGYKVPVLYLLGGILLATIAVGVSVDRTTGINERFLSSTDRHRPPPLVGKFYVQVRKPLTATSGVCRCTIVDIKGNTLTVKDPNSTKTIKVMLPPNDPRATTTLLSVGDMVFIAGDMQNGVFQAFGVRKL